MSESMRVPLHSRKYPGLFAIIDEEDYERAMQFRWNPLRRQDGTFYAITSQDGRIVYMHRLLMNAPGDLQVDHKNRNPLDNRRSTNLRLCTNGQNVANRLKDQDSTMPYKGVRQYGKRKGWMAFIGHDGKQINLGTFTTAIEAAIAFDQAAYKLKGEFAALNFADSPTLPPPTRCTWALPPGVSGYRGVTFHPRNNNWVARVRINGVRTYIGSFASSIEAAQAVDEKIKELGLSLPLSFPD